MSDHELTDRWEAGQIFDVGITHEQHLRIAWVLHRRHGAAAAKKRLLDGTRRACERHGCPEKFDPEMTERWADAIAKALEEDGPGRSAGTFLASHPWLRRGDLFG